MSNNTKYRRLIDFTICNELYLNTPDNVRLRTICDSLKLNIKGGVKLTRTQSSLIKRIINKLTLVFDDTNENYGKYIQEFFLKNTWKEHIKYVSAINS